MARKVFYSFNYAADFTRAAAVRALGVVEGNASAPEKDWAALTKADDVAIQRWIDGQLAGRECTIILIGANTAGRRWIKYEIEKSWADKKGLLGIHIHNLTDAAGAKAANGKNPFDGLQIKSTGAYLAKIVKVYEPLPTGNRAIGNYLGMNLAKRVDEAMRIRSAHPYYFLRALSDAAKFEPGPTDQSDEPKLGSTRGRCSARCVLSPKQRNAQCVRRRAHILIESGQRQGQALCKFNISGVIQRELKLIRQAQCRRPGLRIGVYVDVDGERA